jgi:hypothetical protein
MLVSIWFSLVVSIGLVVVIVGLFWGDVRAFPGCVSWFPGFRIEYLVSAYSSRGATVEIFL